MRLLIPYMLISAVHTDTLLYCHNKTQSSVSLHKPQNDNFLSHFSSFWLACAMRACLLGHCYYHSSVFFFFFFFLSVFCSWPTSGNLPCLKICFPQYFGITRRNIFFLKIEVIFIFLPKKADFRAFFRHGQRSVAEPGPTPSPWSIA